MSEEKTTLSEERYPQLQRPFDQKLHAEITGNPTTTVVTLNGETMRGLRAITVSSDMDEDTVSLEILHLPSGESIFVDGYLIDGRAWEYLQAAREAGFRPDKAK